MCQKVLFVFLYSVMLTGLAQAQVSMKEFEKGNTSCCPVNYATTQINKLYIKPPVNLNNLKSGEKAKCDIQVTYIDFPENAKLAFDYAVSIWESLISSPVPIRVLAKWDKLEGNILALSRPSTFHLNFEGAQSPNVYYPVALAEKLSGKNINANDPDILCTFNNQFPWYFGTDGDTPINKYDFVSSVLHEITHGLGIAGFLKTESGNGFLGSGNALPSIYDFFIYNAQNQQISDRALFESPSSELHNQLTSGELKFSQNTQKNTDEINAEWLYAPSVWKDGASVYHFDLKYNDELMTPFANLGEAIHNPGSGALNILSKIGWQTVTFDFKEITDLEMVHEDIPVKIGLFSDIEIDTSSVKFVYSINGSNSDTLKLTYDKNLEKFCTKAKIAVQTGEIKYFFSLNTTNSNKFNWPVQAPSNMFKFHIGQDKESPQLTHNPVKMVNSLSPETNFSVNANDNMAIKYVKVEYKLDGVMQEPFYLKYIEDNIYGGKFGLTDGLSENVKLEYRIIAEDESSNSNQKILPSSGFYSVNIFGVAEPIANYYNDFNNYTTDFVLNDFSVSRVPGFADGILHTRHPYQQSVIENEKYNLVAQLRHPVILQEGGIMQFDEVVLVEPGIDDYYSEQLVWDYVVVEGSKDNGNTWFQLCEKYQSASNDDWSTVFKSVLNNGTSVAVGSENLSYKHTIFLTDNDKFSAGDTVVFRFRLAADNSINGWGWAIDNLEIQNLKTGTNNLFTENNLKVYPNPCSTKVFVEYSEKKSNSTKEITLTDLNGNLVFQSANNDFMSNRKIQLDLSNEASGVYFLKVTDERSSSIAKLIKY